MKKLFFTALLCSQCMVTYAQSKKELQDKVAELEKQNRELFEGSKDLTARMSDLTSRVFKLEDENKALKAENAQLKAQLGKQQAAASNEEVGTFLSDTIAAMLLKFYGATTVEERAKYVVDPQRVLPKMRDYYKAGIKPLNKFYWVSGDKNKFNEKSEGAWQYGANLYSLRVALVENSEVRHIVLRTPEGFKLDWEATVQYGETADYMLTQENDEKTFTFHCKIGNSVYGWNDDYNSLFLNGDKLLINRYSKDSPDLARACFLKNGSVDKKINHIIENCEDPYNEYFIIVKAKVFDNGDGHFYFELLDIVSETPSMIVTKRIEKQQQRF